MAPFCFRLYCDGAQAPIQHEVDFIGRPTLSRPCIVALGEFSRQSWALIAEEPGYQGLATTLGIHRYIGAVCRALQCGENSLAWFELANPGVIHAVTLSQDEIQFSPVKYEGLTQGSFAAFRALLAAHHGQSSAQQMQGLQLLEDIWTC